MRLTHHVRTLLLTAPTIAACLVAATAANAACEYQGSLQAGTVECVSWDDDEQPGSDEQPGGTETGTTPVSNDNQSDGTSDEPVCRNGDGEVIPCTIQNDDGDTCYFGSAVGAGGGAGGGAVYLCEPPPEDPDGGADDSTGEPAPAVDPEIVAWRVVASMDLRAIDMQIAPKPVSDDPDSMGLVGLDVWLSANDTPRTWGPQTASASDGPVSVTVTAQVDRIEWDMGDGATVTCTEPGTPFDPERHDAGDESPDCGHTYLNTSDHEPEGLYTVTATSYWTAEWTDGTGQTGTLPFEFTTTEQIRIGELQAIRTG